MKRAPKSFRDNLSNMVRTIMSEDVYKDFASLPTYPQLVRFSINLLATHALHIQTSDTKVEKDETKSS